MNLLRVQSASNNHVDASVHTGAPLDISGGSAAPPEPQGEGALPAFFKRLASAFKDAGKGGRADEQSGQKEGRSGWWFLLPIFLHVVGGIMAFFILRQDDARKARNCLYLGLSLSALVFMPLIVLAVLGGGAAD